MKQWQSINEGQWQCVEVQLTRRAAGLGKTGGSRPAEQGRHWVTVREGTSLAAAAHGRSIEVRATGFRHWAARLTLRVGPL